MLRILFCLTCYSAMLTLAAIAGMSLRTGDLATSVRVARKTIREWSFTWQQTYHIPSEKHGVQGIPAGPSIEQYADAVVVAAQPGRITRNFVQQFDNHPIDFIAQLYESVATDWRFVDDPTVKDARGGVEVDYLRRAEIVLDRNSAAYLAGDCDDEACALLSCLSLSGLDGRLVLSGPPDERSETGHAYVELKLAETSQPEVAENIVARLAKRWNADTLPQHIDDTGIWLVLDGSFPPREYSGKREYVIYPNGSFRQ